MVSDPSIYSDHVQPPPTRVNYPISPHSVHDISPLFPIGSGIFSSELESSTGKGPTELFFEEILNNSDVYNKIYPPYDYGQQVTVTVASVFVSLLKVEENRQVVSYIARLNMTWNDFRLTFDPRVYGTYAIQLPPNSVWQPPVELFNCLDNKEQHRQRDETPVEVRADGQVSLLWYSQIETICVVDVAAFPFDEQWCNLGFSPGLATVDQLIIKTTDFVSSKMGIPEWQLLDVFTFDSHFVQYNRNYSLAEITFHLKRNPQFYIYFVILPTFVVTATCISAMLLPLEMNVGDRVNLGIAGMISLTFLLSVIVGELPRTPGLPLMGKWVIVEMIFCCIGMIVPMVLGVLDRFSFRPGKKKLRIISGIIFVLFTVANISSTVLLFTFPPVRKAPTEYQLL